jgi:hypothetical protein
MEKGVVLVRERAAGMRSYPAFSCRQSKIISLLYNLLMILKNGAKSMLAAMRDGLE